MPTLEPSHSPTAAQAEERGAALALLPIAATLDYYALPNWLQENTLIQFAPQIIAYLAFALWASHNDSIVTRLGLERQRFAQGLRIGIITGLFLGGLNSLVILRLVPSLGQDIAFLKQTPHAQLPMLVMVPWFITGIALFVEFNFRGFVLGRLFTIESRIWQRPSIRRLSPVALVTSALVFSFDPFLLNTFQHLHWIAVWDGLIWGLIWLQTRNLYAPIMAHAVEVLVVYSAVRSALVSSI
jgi:membrane protease YdiL (CAAX protease family)